MAFLAKNDHVLLMRTAGVGRISLAHDLGYPAVRAGHTVHFTHADDYLRVMNQDRVDNSLRRNLRSFLSSDLLLADDLGLQRYAAEWSVDLYELIINGAVDEWLSLIEDPILGNSAVTGWPTPTARW